MSLKINSVLQSRFEHPRDSFIKFYSKGHKYDILCDIKSKYTSVTTWNHSHFPKFNADDVIANIFKSKGWGPEHKYWGQTAEEIKNLWTNNGSTAGTEMHYEIECFMNNPNLPINYTHKDLYENYMMNNKETHCTTSLEWQYFIEFIKETPNLKPYRTEWTIYHEDIKLAGSIDMIYENPDGTLSIYDWKRSKEIKKINNWNKYALTKSICQMPDANFWHYALQLNTYKAILEAKYDKKVTDLYLVRLHPDAEEKTYELIKVPDLSSEMTELFTNIKKE